ncbi:radical SAM protein [Flavobacterium psychrophilum]|uniref:B12-binding domain-containing radical SAM protein n=1 Tax=Flavobacterium psychrophilum TaxID=96345 RepID=UPI0004F7EAC3|nr:radical SAM protein [Flavobacterium psychrophilum]AIN73741.1 Fe-S oxidoreductase [Flavobacterium psychrophilum FPG3]EKT2069728.1 radical SAM protein [Flavobacterium psychrophilum]EKT2071988.1 radical SAM protein [Flavobacterium psychrophilum]EKT4491510.1 radical SAM protein [Flavobacterium psychrophilum]EKT4519969.1 radical SAM protein [Flavobacterium psychrophilum]
MKDLLLITPPFTQLNTPYPATAYIKGFLNTKNISAFQIDLGIEVILELFSKKGLEALFGKSSQVNSPNSKRIFALKDDYIKTIDAVIAFLQGNNPTLARQICSGDFLPEAFRFEQLDDMEWAFGSMGMQDKAKHLATLYLEDLSDFVVECIDDNFGFSRYAERLGRSANSFDDLYSHLLKELTYIDAIALAILKEKMHAIQPKLVCISVPFPGNLYSAFRCAQFIKTNFPGVKTSMGGGFPNTELRSLTDVRVFEFFDFITLDDGELPLQLIIDSIQLTVSNEFKRTFLLEDNQVVYKNNTLQRDYKQSEVGTPDYSDLLLDKYISVIEIANPMHSLWSDGRWNKLTMAHGCYWGKCTFCDISLDYIKVYEPILAKTLVDRMEELIAQTGENGFHFVDEAAPPALMRELALEIIKRKLVVTWWTNIRFEKSFSQDLCVLLKASGCIAVSGGLEVASDRLLQLIKKGVTVEQVAQVTRNFTEAGIMVHAYLMYGYPTQTIQETVDSLEMVRQLFELGILQSGFWHQFAMTAHSPVGMFPDEFGVIPQSNEITFANNDIQFTDKTGINHDQFSFGLKKSLFNYMHGLCFDYTLQDWFDFKIPKTTVKPNFIYNSIQKEENFSTKPSARIVWIGGKPLTEIFIKSKKGNAWEMIKMTFHDKKETFVIDIEKEKGDWLLKILNIISIHNDKKNTFLVLKTDFEENFDDFELFWYSKPINTLRNFGLLVL